MFAGPRHGSPMASTSLRSSRAKTCSSFDARFTSNNPDAGEWLRMEASLSKTTALDAGVATCGVSRASRFRMPTALESVARVRIAGESTVPKDYEYEKASTASACHPARTLARAANADL